jgi:hypothetical protein
MRSRPAALLFAAASFAAILVATVSPVDQQTPSSISVCIICGTYGLADAIRNVVLYVPFGIGLAASGLRGRRILLVAGLLAGTIEVAQVFIVAGRDGNPVDVVTNILGAAIGWGLIRSARWWARPLPATSRRFAALAFLCAVALFTGTLALLRPHLPTSAYFGQWTPELGDLEQYEGRLIGVTIAGDSIPSRRLTSPDRISDLLRRRDEVRLDLIAGPAPPGLAPIFAIADHRQRQILLIGADEQDLVYRLRARSADLRLDQPHLRVRDFFRDVEAGDTIALRIRWADRTYCASINEREHCNIGISAGRGWAILQYSTGRIEDLASFLDMVWLALLLLPTGFWCPSTREVVIYGGLATAGLLAVGSFASFGVSPMLFAGAMLGLLIGRLARLRIGFQAADGAR